MCTRTRAAAGKSTTMAAGTASRMIDRCSRCRPSSRHDSGAISALRPRPVVHETGAVDLAGPALMSEVLAVAPGVAALGAVAGTVVVAVLVASGAVAGTVVGLAASGAVAGVGAA